MCKTEQLTRAEYVALSPEERKKAREDGRVNQLLGRAVAGPEVDAMIITRDQYLSLSPSQRRAARQAGLLDGLLGVTE